MRALTPKAQPTILLVGGSSRLKGLKEALEGRLGCPTSWWEHSEYATVLGAVAEASLTASRGNPDILVKKHPLSMGDSEKRPPYNVLVPSLGESVADATIVAWIKQDGAIVRNADVLAVLETNTVTIDIEAGADGR